MREGRGEKCVSASCVTMLEATHLLRHSVYPPTEISNFLNSSVHRQAQSSRIILHFPSGMRFWLLLNFMIESVRIFVVQYLRCTSPTIAPKNVAVPVFLAQLSPVRHIFCLRLRYNNQPNVNVPVSIFLLEQSIGYYLRCNFGFATIVKLSLLYSAIVLYSKSSSITVILRQSSSVDVYHITVLPCVSYHSQQKHLCHARPLQQS